MKGSIERLQEAVDQNNTLFTLVVREDLEQALNDLRELLAASRVIVRIHNLPGQPAADAAAWEQLVKAIQKVDGK